MLWAHYAKNKLDHSARPTLIVGEFFLYLLDITINIF